jgi:predicted Zn-dependent protease
MLEKLHMDGQNPYLSTHPLTQDRMVHIRNHVEETKAAQAAVPKEFIERHARMLGKLRGFLNRPEETFAAYPKENNSVEAHYARAVAYYKQSDLPNALAEIDDLIIQSPSDPYFIELKAQMLYEHGQLAEATVFYRKAVELLPDSALIRTALGTSMLGSGKETDTEDAVTQLKKALELEPRYIDAWRQLAGAYNRQKKTGLYHLALAEENYLLGKNKEVTKYSRQAAGELPGDSPSWYRAKDLEMLAENAKKKQP